MCVRFDSVRFIASSLSTFVDNLAEGKDCNCVFEYENVNYNLTKYKFLSCNKNYSNKIDEKLTKQFNNTFTFSNNDEYMDEWEKFTETLLPKKKNFTVI